jgi:cullin-associated NEDD8-dissociated protein 1
MSNQADVFTQAINRFNADDEEIRTASAFAAGNIAIGNTHQFLPPIIKLVQTDNSKRLLALHAIKEVICIPMPRTLHSLIALIRL